MERRRATDHAIVIHSLTSVTGPGRAIRVEPHVDR